ncbi:MAG: lipase 1-like protein [Candidatus Saccharibacteria bacterium]|nr:lipase 1-like protein [Candidatus Saccharibacteria bacterium]
MAIRDTLVHRWFKVPYALHIHTDQHGKNSKATVLFIHGIGNSGAAWKEVTHRLPDHIRVISIDLLGFGDSKRPPWAVYSVKTQARSVLATLFKLRITHPIIIVGHSLGALVAVEIAKRYPLLVRSLILCSPPFYQIDEEKRRLIPRSDNALREIYMLAHKHPEQFLRISTLAARLGLVNKAFNLTTDNVSTYMNALESSIINQTSLKDAMKLALPIQIINGRLDPVVVGKNLRNLKKANANVSLASILASHEIKGPIYINAVISAVLSSLEKRH